MPSIANSLDEYRRVGFSAALAVIGLPTEKSAAYAKAYSGQHRNRTAKFTKIATEILRPETK